VLKEQLKKHHLILASGSPRRQHFFKDLDLDFEIRLKPVEEIYPEELKHLEITDYLVQLKALPFKKQLNQNDILITSDTIVWHNNEALGKPKDEQEAFNMIRSMSGLTHEVLTSVCFTSNDIQKTVNNITKVTFKKFSDDEIWYYVRAYKPLDKAGAYGIQDWIGLVGVTNLEGSYFNVMGLPTHLVYQTLLEIVK
jgi:septum formation protein